VHIVYNMNHFLHSMQNILFDITLIIWAVLLVLTYFHVFESAPYYLDAVNNGIKIYISLFLLWRFNDFRKVEFTTLDKKIIFNAALYLFFSTILVQIFVNKLAHVDKDAHEFAKKYVEAH
jgi:hypothetical protein